MRVKREGDPDSRWNYEVIRTSGKEWGFEVDPNGKFLKKHTELRKQLGGITKPLAGDWQCALLQNYSCSLNSQCDAGSAFPITKVDAG